MNKFTTCDLCPRYCKIQLQDVGFCNARKNSNGQIISISYGKLLSLGLDPIEKKPLAYYKPGSLILSAGTFGCNMKCPFCQNHEIARAGEFDFKTYEVSPKELVKIAENKRDVGNIGIAFTYNEPLVGFEYVYDTAKLAKENNLETVLVSNGQINEKYLLKLLPYVSAWNIDLKCFSEEGYKNMGGDLKTTVNTIKLAVQHSNVEVTTLVVPGISDNMELLEEQVKFLSDINPDIPLHLTRYTPNYNYKEPATDVELLFKMQKIAKKYLNHVLVGNI